MRILTTTLLTVILVLTGCTNVPGNPLFDVITGSGNAATATQDVREL